MAKKVLVNKEVPDDAYAVSWDGNNEVPTKNAIYDKIETLGGSSPLTTKGDIYTYSTVDARLGVGTNTHVLTADSTEATGMKWAAPVAPSGNSTANTGTAISLAYTLGNYCNMGTANTNTTFTTTGAVTGGVARVLINTATQPTVTGATLEGGTGGWIASTDIYMDVYYDGTNTKYSFRSSDTLESSSDVTITSIASNEILKWNGTAWINQTLAEAGISDDIHANITALDAVTGTNTGDQTSIVGITGTKAQFNTAVSDGDIQYVGDAPTTHNHNTETIVVGDHGTGTTDEVVNVCYGTSATPPTASTTTEGTLYIQYTA